MRYLDSTSCFHIVSNYFFAVIACARHLARIVSCEDTGYVYTGKNHLPDIICLNSFLLHKNNNGKLTRVNLLLEYIEKTIELYQIEDTTNEAYTFHRKTFSRLRTKVVHRQKLNSRKVPLCVLSCFKKYHSERIN